MTLASYKTSILIVPKSTFAICVYLTLVKKSYIKVFIINYWKLKMIIYITKIHYTGSPGPGRKMKLNVLNHCSSSPGLGRKMDD